MRVTGFRRLVGVIAGGLAFLGLLAAPALAAPELAVTHVSPAPAGAAAGDSFKLKGKVVNRGRPAAKALVTVLLDEAGQADSTQIGQRVTGKVQPGKSLPFKVRATIPGDLLPASPTTFQVRVCAQNADRTGPLHCKPAGSISIAGPGARTLGDELFPQTGNGGYDVGNYRIELDYDPESNEFLDGTKTTISAIATESLTELSLDFQDIPVSSVAVDGRPAASFEQVDAEPDFSDDPDVTQPMKLVVRPSEPILATEPFEVVVEYAGTPVLVVDADTSWEGWIPACYPLDPPQTCDGAFVVNEPIGAQGWFPGNNFPTDKATFDTVITVPSGHEAVGIGELVSNEATDGKRTWSWSEDDPTSTYLTTATVGDFIFTERDITEELTGRSLPQYEFIDATATQPQLDTINTALGRTEEMTNYLSERFGPYPYDSGGAVADRAAGVGYALEVATKSHYAGGFSTGNPNISQGTLAHEISHQWMGNAVTLANWTDIWFQEGWAQWVTWSWNFDDGTSPNSPAAQWQSNYESGPAGKWDMIPTELGGDPANLFAFFPTYVRGAMTYEGYRQIVGEATFFDFARTLQTRFAYDNVSTEDVVDLALEISGFTGAELTLLADYFDQWLNQAGRPTITPEDFT